VGAASAFAARVLLSIVQKRPDVLASPTPLKRRAKAA